jgi:hypothetical protein
METPSISTVRQCVGKTKFPVGDDFLTDMAVSALADVALDTTVAAEPARRLVVRERRVSMKGHPTRVE